MITQKKLLIASLLFLIAEGANAVDYAARKSITTAVPATSAAVNLILSGANYHQLIWTVSGTVTTCQVRLDSSADGTTWNAGDVIAAQTCTSNGSATVATGVKNYVRINVTVKTGSGTVTPVYYAYVNNPGGTPPRLDQVLDPTADKTFDLTTKYLNFLGTGGSFIDFATDNVSGPVTTSTYFDFDPDLGISVTMDITGNFAGSSTRVGISSTVNDKNNLANGSAAIGFQSVVSARSNSSSTMDDIFAFYGANSYAGSGIEGLRNSYIVFSDPLVSSGGGTVKNNFGYYSPDESVGTNVYGHYAAQNAGTNKWAYYGGGTADSYDGGRRTIKSNAARVNSVTFTGAGLNDATSGGTFTATNDLAYCVQVDASVPSPDTFEWGTGGSCSNGATGVGITGAAQNLSNGVQITFAAIDGHTIGDNWTFTAYAPIPLTLQDHNGNITYKVLETGRVQLGNVTFGDLGTVVPGQTFYCPDCDPSTVSGIAQECTSAGTKTGAVVTGTNAKWVCMSVN